MKPKFSVGEVVILQSKNLIHYNGEHTIQEILKPGEFSDCPIGSGMYGSFDTYTYRLGFSFEWMGGICDGWQESALRKKHQPSSQSFTELITSLKSPQKA